MMKGNTPKHRKDNIQRDEFEKLINSRFEVELLQQSSFRTSDENRLHKYTTENEEWILTEMCQRSTWH